MLGIDALVGLSVNLEGKFFFEVIIGESMTESILGFCLMGL